MNRRSILTSHKQGSYAVAGLLAMLIALFFSVPPVFAQMNPFETYGAEAPLQSASPSGGLNSSTYIGRARDAAGMAGAQNPYDASSMPANPYGGQGANPYDQPMTASPEAMAAGAMPADPYGGGMMGPGGYQVGPTPLPTPPPVRVLEGERVYSALQFGSPQPELLNDADINTVPRVLSELKRLYYDDGTNGDIKAGDDVWSKVVERYDVMSPNEFRTLRRLLSAVINIENNEPREFFRYTASTSSELSSLPKEVDLEKERDVKLEVWNEIALAKFRIDPKNRAGDFYPVYVPPPPPLPEVELPAGFNPTMKTFSGRGGAGTGYDMYGTMGPAGGGAASPMGDEAGVNSVYGRDVSGGGPTSTYIK